MNESLGGDSASAVAGILATEEEIPRVVKVPAADEWLFQPSASGICDEIKPGVRTGGSTGRCGHS